MGSVTGVITQVVALFTGVFVIAAHLAGTQSLSTSLTSNSAEANFAANASNIATGLQGQFNTIGVIAGIVLLLIFVRMMSK